MKSTKHIVVSMNPNQANQVRALIEFALEDGRREWTNRALRLLRGVHKSLLTELGLKVERR